MKTKIFIYSTIFLIIASLFAYIVVCGKQVEPKPETPAPTPIADINYVSLGDSIAEGAKLDTDTSKDANGFVPGSYAHTFKTMLEDAYETVNAVNYATSGHTSSDLYNLLNSISESEPTAAQQQTKTNIQNADIITICIGANDILAPAQNNLVSYFMGTDITPSLDNGITNLTYNFPSIVSTLQTLNPNAELVFLNVYNPYKELMDTSSDIGIIPATKIKEIGTIAETYISDINQIISSNISNKDNCHLIDVKTCFDNYYSTKKTANAEIKYDVVNVNLLSQSSISLADIGTYIDPHPTALGHQQIASLLNDWYNTTIK